MLKQNQNVELAPEGAVAKHILETLSAHTNLFASQQEQATKTAEVLGVMREAMVEVKTELQHLVQESRDNRTMYERVARLEEQVSANEKTMMQNTANSRWAIGLTVSVSIPALISLIAIVVTRIH